MKSDHPSLRRTALLLCVVSLAACAGGDTSGDAQGDDPSILRWGGDLLGGGSNISIAEDVAGDVMIAGGQLNFSGAAGGDYLGAGRTHVINGQILGSVRAAGNDVHLGGRVARNVTAAAQLVEVRENATIDGNAYLAGQLVRIEGTIGGSMRAMAQRVVLNGTVDGSVDVRGGMLQVGPDARITGDLTHNIAPENVVIDPGAQISGSVNALTPEQERDGPPIGLFRLLIMLAFLVTGVVLVAVFARTAVAAEAALRRRPGAALGLGVAWVILVPIVAAMVALTIIGIPLALIALVLYLISLYIGRIVVALWLGRLLLRGWMRPERGRLIAAFLLGAVVLLLLCLIPYVGTLVLLLATFAGLGALVLAWRGRGGADAAG